MTDGMRMWTEVIFNLAYLFVIYFLVVKMRLALERGAGSGGNIPGASAGPAGSLRLFTLGFLLLAIGDTGHVGFRVLAYAAGSLESSLSLGSFSIPLVGWGALSTAYTVTVLYMLILEVWRRRFGKKAGFIYFLLMAFGAARLVIMAFPQNEWYRVVPVYSWSLVRNGFLTALGLGLAVVMLVDANRTTDRTFRNLAICIFISYGFYIPVILFVQQVPVIGMLMIPKTLAYVAMAWIGYRDLFRPAEREEAAAPGATTR